MNPLKSNFNYVKKRNIETNLICYIIKKIIEENKDNIFNINKKSLEVYSSNELINNDLFFDNIISILTQLKNNEFKYNIQWGIDSKNLYAIPYRSKDKPIDNSSFISCIQTIFLTYYYYIIINEYKIDDNILNFIKKNKNLKKIIRVDETILNINFINELFFNNEEIKKKFFNYLFEEIFNIFKLPEYHYNTSFIDIINIDNIFKIGYSGTININLPKLESPYQFNEKCIYNDEDESNNIEYAIKKSKINLNSIENILDFIAEYDALIDICGYFYNMSNYKVALDIKKILNRDVIFIDEKDEKIIINENNKIEKLNENIKYNKPFFYYDQSHIVGIDIKQDNYPILHGLCIVDNFSYYSEVAQAIFRLRKLNMGHKVSFILKDFKLNNSTELLCKFRYNETNLIAQQKDILNLQALKSDIRKKIVETNDDFIENYKEKIFYYFYNKLSMNPLELIFNKENTPTIDLPKYDLTEEKIKKIVFNLDFKITEIQHQVNTQTQNQTQNQSQNQTQNQTQINIKNEEYIFIFNILKNFQKYKFKNFDFMKTINNNDNFNKYTIKINNLLSFLPNIFYTNFYSSDFCIFIDNTDFNLDLIFMYIPEIEKFILIPKYMIFYLNDYDYDFLLYDINLNIINLDKKILVNNDKLDELEDNLLVKIITNNFTLDDFHSLECNLNEIDKVIDENIIGNYLSALIFLYINIFLENYNTNFYCSKLLPYFKFNFKKIIDTINFDNHNELIRNKITQYSHSLKYKYLKYKKKYLKLKKLIDN